MNCEPQSASAKIRKERLKTNDPMRRWPLEMLLNYYSIGPEDSLEITDIFSENYCLGTTIYSREGNIIVAQYFPGRTRN